MDGRLILGALLGAPALAAVLAWATGAFGPLAGALGGLLLYWCGLASASLWALGAGGALALLPPRRPGAAVTAALAVATLGAAALAMPGLGAPGLSGGLLAGAALAGLVHGTLEELFWRGAALPRPGARPAALALAAYAVFHLAWGGARGIDWGLTPPLLLLGPLALGGALTAARLVTGTVGAGALAHAVLAACLFVAIAARTAA
jgi:hypothetical protein